MKGRTVKNMLIFFFLMVWAGNVAAGEVPDVSIVTEGQVGAPVGHGLGKLADALSARQVTFERVLSPAEARGRTIILVGLSGGDGPAATMLKSAGYPLPSAVEGLTIRRASFRGRAAWVVSGYDDRGLMYAL